MEFELIPNFSYWFLHLCRSAKSQSDMLKRHTHIRTRFCNDNFHRSYSIQHVIAYSMFQNILWTACASSWSGSGGTWWWSGCWLVLLGHSWVFWASRRRVRTFLHFVRWWQAWREWKEFAGGTELGTFPVVIKSFFLDANQPLEIFKNVLSLIVLQNCLTEFSGLIFIFVAGKKMR